MNPFMMMELAQEHQAELLEEARLERLAREARAARSGDEARRPLPMRGLVATALAVLALVGGRDILPH